MEPKAVRILYTNYKGETSQRLIEPRLLFYGSSQYHHEPQWLLDALDLGKGEIRTFAMKDILIWSDTGKGSRRFTACMIARADSSAHLLDAFTDMDECLGKGVIDSAKSTQHYDYAMMVHEEPKP